MASWQEFEAAEPELAKIGAKRLDDNGVLLVGTIRKDGTPRISPVEPVFLDGELYLGMMWQSKKALDLLRDPRVLLHSTVLDRNATGGDFKVRGRVREIADAETHKRYAQAMKERIGEAPEDEFHLFAVDIEHVAHVTFDEAEMKVRQWRAA